MSIPKVLIKSAAVASSLCLMAGFVWYRTARAKEISNPPPPVRVPTETPAESKESSGQAAFMPGSKSFVMNGEWDQFYAPQTLPGSKGGIVLHTEDATTTTPALDPAQRRIMIHSTKSAPAFTPVDVPQSTKEEAVMSEPAVVTTEPPRPSQHRPGK